MIRTIFYLDPIPNDENKYLIRYHNDKFPAIYTTGSFNILAARVCNLDYPTYLRMCRDLFGATLVGRNSLYPVAYFPNDPKTTILINWLNARASAIMFEREHPDYAAHNEELNGVHLSK